MKTFSENWWKILILALAGAGAAYGLHQVIPSSPSMDNIPFSTLVVAIGFPAVVGSFFVIAFSLILAIFILIQDRLCGTRLSKGLRYGATMGLVWYAGLLEASSIVGTSLAAEGIMAVADVVPVIGICILLALWAGSDSPAKVERLPDWRSIPLIALTYCIGRMLIYTLFQFESGYATRTAATLLWTAGMGLSIGAAFWLLAAGLTSPTRKAKILWFGLAFFGLNWWVFNLFAPLVLGASFLDFTVRSGMDMAFVMAGIFLSESIHERKTL